MEEVDFGEEKQTTKDCGRKYKLWHLVVAFIVGAVIVAAAFLAPSFGTQGFLKKRSFDSFDYNRLTPKIDVREQDFYMDGIGLSGKVNPEMGVPTGSKGGFVGKGVPTGN